MLEKERQAQIKKSQNISDLKSNQDSIQHIQVNTINNDDFSSVSISPLYGKASGNLITSNSPKSHAFGSFEVKTMDKMPQNHKSLEKSSLGVIIKQRLSPQQMVANSKKNLLFKQDYMKHLELLNKAQSINMSLQRSQPLQVKQLLQNKLSIHDLATLREEHRKQTLDGSYFIPDDGGLNFLQEQKSMTNLDNEEIQRRIKDIMAYKKMARLEDYNHFCQTNANIIEERQEKKVFAEIDKQMRERNRDKQEKALAADVRKQHKVCFPIEQNRPVLFDNKVKSPSRFLKSKDEVLLDKLSKQVKRQNRNIEFRENSDLKLLTGFGNTIKDSTTRMAIQENVYTDEDGNIVCMESDIDTNETPEGHSPLPHKGEQLFGQTLDANASIFDDPIKVQSKFNTTFAGPSDSISDHQTSDPLKVSKFSKEQIKLQDQESKLKYLSAMKKAKKDFIKSKHEIIQSGVLTDPEVIKSLEEINNLELVKQIDSKRALIKQNSFEINDGTDVQMQNGLHSNSSILNKNFNTFSQTTSQRAKDKFQLPKVAGHSNRSSIKGSSLNAIQLKNQFLSTKKDTLQKSTNKKSGNPSQIDEFERTKRSIVLNTSSRNDIRDGFNQTQILGQKITESSLRDSISRDSLKAKDDVLNESKKLKEAPVSKLNMSRKNISVLSNTINSQGIQKELMIRTQISNKSKFGAMSLDESPTMEPAYLETSNQMSPRLRANAEMKPLKIEVPGVSKSLNFKPQIFPTQQLQKNSSKNRAEKSYETTNSHERLNKSGSNKDSKYSLIPKSYVEFSAKLDKIKNETMIFLPPVQQRQILQSMKIENTLKSPLPVNQSMDASRRENFAQSPQSGKYEMKFYQNLLENSLSPSSIALKDNLRIANNTIDTSKAPFKSNAILNQSTILPSIRPNAFKPTGSNTQAPSPNQNSHGPNSFSNKVSTTRISHLNLQPQLSKNTREILMKNMRSSPFQSSQLSSIEHSNSSSPELEKFNLMAQAFERNQSSKKSLENQNRVFFNQGFRINTQSDLKFQTIQPQTSKNSQLGHQKNLINTLINDLTDELNVLQHALSKQNSREVLNGKEEKPKPKKLKIYDNRRIVPKKGIVAKKQEIEVDAERKGSKKRKKTKILIRDQPETQKGKGFQNNEHQTSKTHSLRESRIEENKARKDRVPTIQDLDTLSGATDKLRIPSISNVVPLNLDSVNNQRLSVATAQIKEENQQNYLVEKESISPLSERENKNQSGTGNEALMRIRSRDLRNSNPGGQAHQYEIEKSGLINKTPVLKQRNAKDKASKEEDKSERREVLSRLHGQERSSIETKPKATSGSYGLNTDITELSPVQKKKVKNLLPKFKDSNKSFRNLFLSSNDRDNQLPIFQKKVHMTREQIEANTIIKFNRDSSRQLDQFMSGKAGRTPKNSQFDSQTVKKESRYDSSASPGIKPIKIRASVDHRDSNLSRPESRMRESVDTTVLDSSPKASKYTDNDMILKSPRTSEMNIKPTLTKELTENIKDSRASPSIPKIFPQSSKPQMQKFGAGFYQNQVANKQKSNVSKDSLQNLISIPKKPKQPPEIPKPNTISLNVNMDPRRKAQQDQHIQHSLQQQQLYRQYLSSFQQAEESKRQSKNTSPQYSPRLSAKSPYRDPVMIQHRGLNTKNQKTGNIIVPLPVMVNAAAQMNVNSPIAWKTNKTLNQQHGSQIISHGDLRSPDPPEPSLDEYVKKVQKQTQHFSINDLHDETIIKENSPKYESEELRHSHSLSLESESVKRLKARQDENAPLVTGSEIKIMKQNSSDPSIQSHVSLKSESEKYAQNNQIKTEHYSSPRKNGGGPQNKYMVEQSTEEINSQKPKFVVENTRYNNPLLTRPIESVMEVNEDKSISSSQEGNDKVAQKKHQLSDAFVQRKQSKHSYEPTSQGNQDKNISEFGQNTTGRSSFKRSTLSAFAVPNFKKDRTKQVVKRQMYFRKNEDIAQELLDKEIELAQLLDFETPTYLNPDASITQINDAGRGFVKFELQDPLAKADNKDFDVSKYYDFLDGVKPEDMDEPQTEEQARLFMYKEKEKQEIISNILQFKDKDAVEEQDQDPNVTMASKMASLQKLSKKQLDYVLGMLSSSTRWHVPINLIEAQNSIVRAGQDEFWGNDSQPKQKKQVKRSTTMLPKSPQRRFESPKRNNDENGSASKKAMLSRAQTKFINQ